MKEQLARIFGITLLLSLSIAIFAGNWIDNKETITIHASMPDKGGWSPNYIKVDQGETLKLKITSDDVLHGFAIGKSDQPSVDIFPGKVTELTLSFDKPGKYVFYCDRWCGVDHWRMRGTIEVLGEGIEETSSPPLYQQLGLDIDAHHESQILPTGQPQLIPNLNSKYDLSDYLSPNYYKANAPEKVWRDLRSDPKFSEVDDQSIWDMVASIWWMNTNPTSIMEGADLYARNCSACHGENGAGDGVFSHIETGNISSMVGHGEQPATNFNDPAHMLSLAPASAQGKILRGGMGTGMPMWGDIFTEEQTWSLVSFLYQFQFKEVTE